VCICKLEFACPPTEFICNEEYSSNRFLIPIPSYWQVEVAEDDWEKTAFTTSRGLYQWRSMPVGLTNSPATCQRMMELVLRGLPWQVCMVYLDDVLIYSPTFEGHFSSLREVFSRIQSAGFRLNPKKVNLPKIMWCSSAMLCPIMACSQTLETQTKSERGPHQRLRPR
jgi:hypothetical protein